MMSLFSRERWNELDTKTKLMAFGTIVLVLVSICLALSNCSVLFRPEKPQSSTNSNVIVEEGVTIEKNSSPILVADKDTKLVTYLVEILENDNCLWKAGDQPICSLVFTDGGFIEYYGDIQASATYEFYTIEVTENGRTGTWRVTYEDGTRIDARFSFVQNSERGVYIFSSSAFRQQTAYESAVFSSEDVLAW